MTRLVTTVFGDQSDVRGWLSLPSSLRKTGVVVCAPFGHPDICSYRPLRTLAASLAEDGWPVLRFDWPGVGDSADPASPVTSVDAWVSVVRQAVDHLRQVVGVHDVALVGLRIGATIAAVAAADPAVTDVALLAPYATGRAYLRELRAFQAMFSAPLSTPAMPPAPLPAGATESAGFVIPPEEVAALEALDLDGIVERSLRGRRVLVATAQPSDAVTAVVGRSRAVADVTHVESEDVALLSSEAISSVFPPGLHELVRDWLDDGGDERGAPDVSAPGRRTVVALDQSVSEEAVVLSTPRGRLVGVTCEPENATGPWVVFLSAGAVRRIGPNRLWTTFARRWALAGRPSLRIDLHGVGDSDGAREHDEVPGESISRMYEDDVSNDVTDALEWLATSRGADSFVLIGLCSGAHWGLWTAVSNPRVVGVGLVNPVTLEWDPSVPAIVAFDAAARFIQRPRSIRSALAKGLGPSGRLAVRGAAARVALAARTRSAGGRLRGRLETLAARGTECHFVFGRDEDGLLYLRRMLGSDYASELQSMGMTIEIVDGIDHTFKPVWSHDVLRRSLEAHLPALGAEDAAALTGSPTR